mmetsp:Transcript_680/g.1942  ORF Transcript_680/g.1942 Transcript_680/m.1942 type:complete len:411 (+) Transcript_680:72-1304(+)
MAAAVDNGCPMLCEPIGAPPHVGVRLRPMSGALGLEEHAGGFVADLSKGARLSELRLALSVRLGVPGAAVTLVSDGRTLDHAATLQDCGVTLPGPARRRAGERLELSFDTVWEVMEERRTAEAREAAQARAAGEEAGAEERRRREAQREREAILGQDRALDDFLEERGIGPSPSRLGEQRRPEDLARFQQHSLAPCPEEVRSGVEQLMRAVSGKEYVVTCVRRLQNPVVRERFERAKQGLRGVAIKREVAKTASACQDGRAGVMGDCEYAVNELPLWHGTSVAAVGGICATGFDIAYAGAQGSAWSPGFYFADDPNTSHRYAKDMFTVNAKYSGLHVMLLCRVLCGTVYHCDQVPDEDEQGRLTARCLGPGGTFGPTAEYHSILGGGYAHVCLHRDQVYPEFVIVYDLKH